MSIELIHNINQFPKKLLSNKRIDGDFQKKLFESMINNGLDEIQVSSIFSNAYKVLDYFIDPNYSENGISKILCLGKVQSGKTAFFMSSISLAFDNGYDIVYLIGGTKNNLRDQNYERVKFEFSNNDNIVVLDLNSTSIEEIELNLKNSKKIILVVLKNPNENKNLGLLKKIIVENKNLTSLLIDDEGDEYTPGAPKVKKVKKAGRTHDVIEDIINSFSKCTYLSVTATPQALLLLNCNDIISPDYCVLVEPGAGYTGGNAFHDTMENKHMIEIDDADDFSTTVPESFFDCIYEYIFSCCLQMTRGNTKPFSMLVHPSNLTYIHQDIAIKINDAIIFSKGILLDKNHIAYDDHLNKIKQAFTDYCCIYACELSFEEIITKLPLVLNNLKVYICNNSKIGRASLQEEKKDNHLYKIYVGGNMLGRGLTIKNLIVTYIYRDSKESAVDTLYQRARWFGYKLSYFDVCKVYMTKSLMEKFVKTTEHENNLWDSITSFLLNKINIKELPRMFVLNSDNLILTRKTVSKTITLTKVSQGFTTDTSIYYSNVNYRKENRELYEQFFENIREYGYSKSYSNNNYQTHFVCKIKFSELYDKFLSKFNYPIGSKFSKLGFEKILNHIYDGADKDEITLMIVRYKTKECRSLIAGGTAVKYLLQGRDDGTGYEGDKYLTDLNGKFYLQIHLVYHDENKDWDYVPMFSMYNPITENNVKYVTGDNNYDSI